MAIKRYSGQASAVNTNLLNIDVTDQYRDDTPILIAVHIINAGNNATVTYQASIDGTNWNDLQGYNPGDANGFTSSTSTTTGLRVFPLVGRYFRARVTAIASGAVTAEAMTSYSDGYPWATGVGTALVGAAVNTGNTISKLSSAANTNPTSVKASAGNLYSILAHNTGAGDAFIKFYNKASAPTVGTDTPIYTIRIPAGQTVIWEPSISKRFSTGIAFAITGAAGDADTTAIAAAQVLFTYEWA